MAEQSGGLRTDSMTNPSSEPRKNPRSLRPFLLVWIIYSGLMLLGVKFLLYPSGLTERMDFRQLYAGAYLVRSNPGHLYDYERQKQVQDEQVSRAEGLLPFIRAAYEGLLFVPLTYLPYRAAYFCFACVNLLLLGACFFICRREFSNPGTFGQPRAGLQMFIFYPAIVAILQGQDSVLLLFGFCLAYRFLKLGRRFVAGFLLGLLVFKFQITIPAVLFLIAAYTSGALALGFAGGSALSATLSLATVGWKASAGFLRALLLTNAASLTANAPHGVLGVAPRAMPNLKGLISAATLDYLPRSAVFGMTIGLSAVIAFWIVRQLISCRPAGDASISMAIVGALLLSYYLHLQDLTLLLLPLALVSASKNAHVQRAIWLLFIAPPLAVLAGHSAIFLLSLLLALLLYGLGQMAMSMAATPQETANPA